MTSFKSTQQLSDFQRLIDEIYSLPDDRLYSLWDLLVQQQRFTMRALKGVRQNNNAKTSTNLLIAFSWLMAVANRLHIDLDNEVWQRFPGVCSYCLDQPCSCSVAKLQRRRTGKPKNSQRPRSLSGVQTMFAKIYPPDRRTTADAGVHLAEEMGEVSEAIHNYSGQHRSTLFDEISLELADYVSCLMGLANSINYSVADGLAKLYYNNCHICHKAPCVCSFALVADLKT